MQTAARRAHRALTDALIDDCLKPCAAEGGGLERAEAELALLAEFLETHDFKRLRADHPELAGGHPVTLVITRAPDGRVIFRRSDT